MISDADLEALTSYIVGLEDQVQWLMEESELHLNGPAVVKTMAHSALEIPPGYDIGQNGQLIAVSTQAAQREIHRRWPVPDADRKPRKGSRKPDGDGV